MFRGTTYHSFFNFGKRGHFIRGGKDGSHIIMNDLGRRKVGLAVQVPFKNSCAGNVFITDKLGIGVRSHSIFTVS